MNKEAASKLGEDKYVLPISTLTAFKSLSILQTQTILLHNLLLHNLLGTLRARHISFLAWRFVSCTLGSVSYTEWFVSFSARFVNGTQINRAKPFVLLLIWFFFKLCILKLKQRSQAFCRLENFEMNQSNLHKLANVKFGTI